MQPWDNSQDVMESEQVNDKLSAVHSPLEKHVIFSL